MSQYIISGATGNIDHSVVEKLLDANHSVRAVGRTVEKLKPLVDKGAEACVGTLENTSFLTSTFEKADSVFCMIPSSLSI